MREKLKQLRVEKNLTQEQVAKVIGVTKSCYSNYEQGLREPSLEIFIKLCKFFDVSADYLLGLEKY